MSFDLWQNPSVSFSPGDEVEQTKSLGLGTIPRAFVCDVRDGRLVLSSTPGGPPITEFDQSIRLYPVDQFRLLSGGTRN